MSDDKNVLDIVLPPVEIRTLIGKTAVYVNKNGEAFENKLKTKENNNPKFFFLSQNDPYNPYYKFALDTIKKTGKPPAVESNDTNLNGGTEPITSSSDDIKRLDSIVAPNDYSFLELNEHTIMYTEDKISYQDLEVIKSVAQFAVLNTEETFHAFQSKVSSNVKISTQFEFLKPKHSMNKIYTKYYNIYNKIKNEKEKLIELYREPLNKTKILDICFQRAEYLEKQRIYTKSTQENKVKENIIIGGIDWQQFVVLETVNFDEFDNIAQLHKPLVKSELEYRSLVEKGTNDLFLDEYIHANDDYEEDREEDREEENFEIIQDGDNDQGVPVYQDVEEADSDDNKQENGIEEQKPKKITKKLPKGMKIKAAGESRLLKRRYQNTDNEIMVDPVTKEKLLTCPITHKPIPESKFQAHISKLLRDPKFEEEKARYESKFKYVNDVSGIQIYENIKGLFETTKKPKNK